MKAYAGQEKLWRVFVFGYLAMLIPMVILAGISKEMLIKNSETWTSFWITLLMIFYNFWLTVSLWRCSRNGDSKVGRIAGRGLAIFIGMQIVLAVQMTVATR
jgi:hypothetical protein